MERIVVRYGLDVAADIGRELRVHLIEHILAVVQRPHLADGLITHTGQHAADGVEHGVGGAALVPRVLLRARQLVGQRKAAALMLERQDVARRCLVLHVVDPGANVDERLHHRMPRDILDSLPVDIHFAGVANRVPILLAGADHGKSSPLESVVPTLSPGEASSRNRRLR